jgi:hypothetical protein
LDEREGVSEKGFHEWMGEEVEIKMNESKCEEKGRDKFEEGCMEMLESKNKRKEETNMKVNREV